jgi:hypothetical protein
MAALIAGAVAEDAANNNNNNNSNNTNQADNEFWSQAFFQDAVDDAHYSTESESADEVDDDFFEPEPVDDDEDANDKEKKLDVDNSDRLAKRKVYVDPRRRRRGAANKRARTEPQHHEDPGPVDSSALPIEWQERIASVESLTVRQLRAAMARDELDTALFRTRVEMLHAIQHNLMRLHADGADLPPSQVLDDDNNNTTNTTTNEQAVSVRGSTKQRTEAIRAEMAVREAEREQRRALQRRVSIAEAPPLTQEQRLLEAQITERQNQVELARLTALHDNMRLQRAALARRKRHIVGPVIRSCSSLATGTTIAFTHPNIDALFERAPPPAHVARASAPPNNVAASLERRRVEAAEQAADVLAKVDTLKALLAASRERAQQQARRPLPANLAAPVVIATQLVASKN